MEGQSFSYAIENALHWAGQHQPLVWLVAIAMVFIMAGKIFRADLRSKAASREFNEQNLY